MVHATALDEHCYHDPQQLADILNSVKSITMAGAKADKTKCGDGVPRVQHEIRYDTIPVNPNPRVTDIRCIWSNHSLAEIDRSVDMVEVFRPKEELCVIAKQPSTSRRKHSGARLVFKMKKLQSWPRDAGPRSVSESEP